jgi:hypothetical protein
MSGVGIAKLQILVDVAEGEVFGNETFGEDAFRDDPPRQAVVTLDNLFAPVREVCGLAMKEVSSQPWVAGLRRAHIW